MTKYKLGGVLTYLIAIVWLINGFFCKVLNFSPRHQQIVGRILGDNNSTFLTKAIGILEILMAIWILSRIKIKLNSIIQIIIIFTMNLLEFVFAQDLLLWGKVNIIFAMLFIIIIYYNEFSLNKKIVS